MLKAFPHYLFSPVQWTKEINEAEEQFWKEWLPFHELNGTVFHYTNALGLLGIVQHREFWLSDISTLSDPREFFYGKDLALNVIEEIIKRASESHIQTFLEKLQEHLKAFGGTVHRGFVICFCESDNLLSQWRAYAEKGRGYSIGFNFSQDTRIAAEPNDTSKFLEPYFRKVIYREDQQREWLRKWIATAIDSVRRTRMRGPVESLSDMAIQSLNLILEMLYCFKTPQFEEENEWRMFRVMLPEMDPAGLEFRASAGDLIPFRRVKIFDRDDPLTFPMRSITCGPGLDKSRTHRAIRALVMRYTDGIPIKLRTNVEITDAGYMLR